MKIVLFFLISFFTLNACISQTDSTNLSSQDIAKKQSDHSSTLKNIFTGKPGKAFALSLLVPGGGQIYNKKWWKLPFVYGAFGASIYFIDFNRKEYKRFNDAFIMRVDSGEVKSKDEFKGILSIDQINLQRKFIDKNLQRSYLSIVGVYLLSGIEAFVNRHFMEFDVSDNIGMQWSPQINNQSAGVSLCLYLK